MLQRTSDLLNGSSAEFKVPAGSTNGSAAVTIPSTDVAYHVTAINHLVTTLKAVTTEFKEATAEIEEAIGQHIKAIKIAEAGNWESVVKAKCGLSRSRAYELMAIAEGTKSAEQTRYETNVRKIRHRQIKSSVPGTDKKELAAVDTKIVELKAAHKHELVQRDALEEGYERQIARFEAEIIRLSDTRDLSSERDRLRKALGEIVELLTEMHGLMTHSEHNRTTITTKLTRAEKIATSALKPAKVATVNLPVKQVA